METRRAFTQSNQRLRYSRRHGLAVGDFDGDGWKDVFAAAYSRDCRVWYNQGDGIFRSQTVPAG